MKLKLGLCHELHHRNGADHAGDFSSATPSEAVIRKTKVRKYIELDDILNNKINMANSGSKRFLLTPYIRIFQDGADAIPNMPGTIGTDPVQNHATQFKQVKVKILIIYYCH